MFKLYRCISGDDHGSAQIQPLLFSLPVFQISFSTGPGLYEPWQLSHRPWTLPKYHSTRSGSEITLITAAPVTLKERVREGDSDSSGVLMLQGFQKDRLGASEIFEKSTAWAVFSLIKRGSTRGNMWPLLRAASHLLLAAVLSNVETWQPFISPLCTLLPPSLQAF